MGVWRDSVGDWRDSVGVLHEDTLIMPTIRGD